MPDSRAFPLQSRGKQYWMKIAAQKGALEAMLASRLLESTTALC
jgi:hypothetical protein